MHLLVVLNSLSRKEESLIVDLSRSLGRDLNFHLAYVIPPAPTSTGGRYPIKDIKLKPRLKQAPSFAKHELARCARLFGCPDSQQWIVMGNVSTESSLLGEKLHVGSILVSDNEGLKAVNHRHHPRKPRIYSVSEYVELYSPGDEECLHDCGFGTVAAIA